MYLYWCERTQKHLFIRMKHMGNLILKTRPVTFVSKWKYEAYSISGNENTLTVLTLLTFNKDSCSVIDWEELLQLHTFAFRYCQVETSYVQQILLLFKIQIQK